MEQEDDFVVYDYSIKNIKTGHEMFGSVNVNVELEFDVSFHDLRPIIRKRAKMDDPQFENPEDIEITLLNTRLEAARGD